MKRIIFTAVLIMCVLSVGMNGAIAPQGKLLDYQIVGLESKAWVVTANEVGTGNVVKFRLPPSAFMGKTFDANLGKINPGQKFSVRGPRNARLNQLVMTKGLPGAEGKGRGVKRLRRRVMPVQQSTPLAWEVLTVDPNRWVVTARNRSSKKTVKIKVDPNCFIGFRFKASLRGIKNGKGFSIVTPNNAPLPNCCTLLSK